MPGQPRIMAKRVRKLLAELEVWGNLFHQRMPKHYRGDGPSTGIACALWRGAANALADHYMALQELSFHLNSKAGYREPELAEVPEGNTAKVLVPDSMVVVDGQQGTVAEWCEEAGVSPTAVLALVARGMDIEEALALAQPDEEARQSNPAYDSATLSI